MDYEDLSALRTATQKNGGLLEVSMEEVRKACGVGRLGVLVRQRIAEVDLPSEGLGYLPEGELPKYQHEHVWLYTRNSPVGHLVSAVLRPSREGEKRLRAAAESGGSRAEEQLREVREALAAIVEALEEQDTEQVGAA